VIQNGVFIYVAGKGAMETAQLLAVRLIEMGRAVEPVDMAVAKRLGPLKSAAYACELLVRNGVIVISMLPRLRPNCAFLDVEVDPNDAPDFATEKILDQLAEAGVITLDASDYSPEDEERVRRRLASLGYIE